MKLLSDFEQCKNTYPSFTVPKLFPAQLHHIIKKKINNPPYMMFCIHAFLYAYPWCNNNNNDNNSVLVSVCDCAYRSTITIIHSRKIVHMCINDNEIVFESLFIYKWKLARDRNDRECQEISCGLANGHLIVCHHFLLLSTRWTSSRSRDIFTYVWYTCVL